MAASARTREGIPTAPQPSNNGLVLIWLDDSAEEEPAVKGVFTSLFDNVLTFTDPDACLELVESIDAKTPSLAILITGKYGQMLVRERLQPLKQVKDIYVFCYDTVKHGRWAQTCDKVRCVFSDINKILQCMQYDIQNTIDQRYPDDDDDEQMQQEEDEPNEQQSQRERYTDDHNLFDQLALTLLLQSPSDGAEDFTEYCRTHDGNNDNNYNPDDRNADEEHQVEMQEQPEYFKPEQEIKEWYEPNLFFTHINSNDLSKLWTLRWFIRSFHRQLTNEHEKFVQEKTRLTVNHGTWLSIDELDGMKHRIGQIIIISELQLSYANRQKALDSIQNDENNKRKVIFEINIDTTNRNTIPYAEIKNEEVLLWFGGRYRLIKIEYVEQQNEHDSYWLIGLNLSSTLDSKPSIQTLYDYYLKELTELNNLHHALGRLFMYKGFYSQAEKWLQTGNHYEELAELAIRQSRYEQAKEYLEQLSEDSDNANLLRAYLNILTSNENLSKARLTLLKIFSEATDKLVRARVNNALGFISLIINQQIDQAFEHFTLSSEVLRKILPDNHPSIAKSLIGIGYTYYMQGNTIEARKSFEKAFVIQKQSFTYNHPDFAKTRNGLAHCLSNGKQTIKQALHESESALNILLDVFRYEHQRHPEILATKNDIEKLRKGKELPLRNTLLDYI